MYTIRLYKDIHFTKKGQLTYYTTQEEIICSEDTAREIIPKYFLSNFPYKKEWFEKLIEVLEEENYAYFYKLYININNMDIETGLMKITIKKTITEDTEDSIQEEIFRKLVNKLKEDSHASSGY